MKHARSAAAGLALVAALGGCGSRGGGGPISPAPRDARRPLTAPACAWLAPTCASPPRAARVLARQDRVTVRAVMAVNTGAEAHPFVTPDGQTLFFQSARRTPWSTPNYSGLNRFDLDLWSSARRGDDWLPPKNLGEGINTPKDQGEFTGTPDGHTVSFCSFADGWQAQGPLYRSDYRANFWRQAIGLGGNVNAHYVNQLKQARGGCITHGGHAFSTDERLGFFSSAVQDLDTMDIYTAERSAAGWSKLERAPFSTDCMDSSPFLAADGKTLYFSSRGYEGLGGSDIYKTVLRDDGTWSDPVNLGAPINSAADEDGFVVVASGKEAYFERGNRIYFADLTQAGEELKPGPSTLVVLTIRDQRDQRPLEADAVANDENTGAFVGRCHSSSIDGRCVLVAPANERSLKIGVQIEGHEPEIHALKTGRGRFTEERATIDVGHGAPERALVLFDFDKADLKQESIRVLDELGARTRARPRLSITIHGHTDDVGTDSYNMALSRRRAEAVRDYLVRAGSPPGRMKLEEFGARRPAAPASTEDGRAQNRRVEITLEE